MLLVPCITGPSQLHGTGVFARDNIPTKTIVWTLKPWFDVVMDEQLLARVPEFTRSRLAPWLYQDERSGLWILCSDDARYMNHSAQPNLAIHDEDMHALRDIAAGEELTCDYREFDLQARTTGKPF